MEWTLDDFLSWFERVYARSLEVAQAVPPDQLDWQPRPGEFSSGDLIRHLASAELMNVARLQSGQLHYPGHDQARLGGNQPAVLAYLEQCHAQAVAILQAEGEAALTKLVPTNQGLIPGWRALVGMIEHEIHHRSQLCSYFAAWNLEPPPLFGLYVEELPQ